MNRYRYRLLKFQIFIFPALNVFKFYFLAFYMSRKYYQQSEKNYGGGYGTYSKVDFSEDRCRQFDSLFTMVRYRLIDTSNSLRIDNRWFDMYDKM